MHRNSPLATTNRQGRSHSTEAWQLPPPAFRREGDVTGGEGGSDRNPGGGAYLGLFRPPGGAKDAMGFHMCVAVIPSGDEGRAGAVAETFSGVRPPPLDQDPETRLGNKVCPVLLNFVVVVVVVAVVCVAAQLLELLSFTLEILVDTSSSSLSRPPACYCGVNLDVFYLIHEYQSMCTLPLVPFHEDRSMSTFP